MNQYKGHLGKSLYTPLKTYRTEIICGHLSIVDAVREDTIICTEEVSAELLQQTADLATELVKNEDLVRFYARYSMYPDISELLSIPDFFTSNVDHPLTQKVLDYHKRYGIPRTVAKIEPLIITAESPHEWYPIYEETEKEERPIFVQDYSEIQVALFEKQAYPLVLTVCFLLDFYNLFLDGTDIDEIDFAILKQSVSLDFIYFPEKKRIVFWGTKDGYWNAAYATALTDLVGGKTYGICKNCGNWFARPRPNADYCSPSCRNVYNVRKSILRRKEKDNQL